MNDVPSLARQARANLAQALNALQEDNVPPQTQALADVVAEAMNLLHRIEKNYGSTEFDRSEHSTRALLLVRNALNNLQAPEHVHPAIERVLEPAAHAVGLVHQLNQLAARQEAASSAPTPVVASNPELISASTRATLEQQEMDALIAAPSTAAGTAPEVEAPVEEDTSAGAPPSGQTIQASEQLPPAEQTSEPLLPAEQTSEPLLPVEQTSESTDQTAEPLPPVQSTADGVDQTSERVDQTSERVDQTSERVDQTSERVDQTSERVDQTAEAADQTSERVDHGSVVTGAQNNAFEPPPERLTSNPERLSSNPERISTHAVALPALDPLPGEVYIEVSLGAYSTSNFYRRWVNADVVDSGGLFVASYTPPELTQNIRIRATLTGGFEFEGRGTVDWRREMPKSGSLNPLTPPGFGVKFTELSEDARKMVHRYSRSREPFVRDAEAS